MSGFDAQFQRGVNAHRAGRLDEAEQCYRAVLRAAPRHAGAIQFMGLLRLQRGDLPGAVSSPSPQFCVKTFAAVVMECRS